jgi:CheY-like chemotaxis protein
MEQSQASGRLRVLVVDDCPDTTWSFSLLLRTWGHDAATVSDGPSALDQVDAYRPDVVLLDIGLPGMDGYEVARRLSVRPASCRPVVVSVSGYGSEEDIRRSRESGCACHLLKPVQPEQLREMLDKFKQGGAQEQPQRLSAGSMFPSLPGG